MPTTTASNHGFFFPFAGGLLAVGFTLALLAGCAEPPAEDENEFAIDTNDAVIEQESWLTPGDLQELRQHELEVGLMQRYAEAAARLQRLAEDPEVREVHAALEDRLDEARSLSEMEAVFSDHPAVAATIRDAGISIRDYLLTGVTLIGAYNVVAFSEYAGAQVERPEFVTEDHVGFITENREEVEVVMMRLADEHHDHDLDHGHDHS